MRNETWQVTIGEENQNDYKFNFDTIKTLKAKQYPKHMHIDKKVVKYVSSILK